MLNTERIDEILNNFLEPFGVKAEMGEDFTYYYYDELITYSFVVSERMDKLFMNYAKSNGLEPDVDIFILSLIHELGHHMTMDDLDDDRYAECLEMKESLGDDDMSCRTYFSLYDEKAATDWAISYINNNAFLLKLWWEECLQPAIMDFYAENGVENE